jgi:hypothetical protein
MLTTILISTMMTMPATDERANLSASIEASWECALEQSNDAPPSRRDRWGWRAPALVYGLSIAADETTTRICLRRGGVETNGLPGMKSSFGRAAWSTLGLGVALAADWQLTIHCHGTWAKALRYFFVAWRALNAAGSLGILHHSWFQTIGLAH